MRIFVLMLSLLLSTAVHAQGAFRAYLASYGSDTNPCTVTAPCRLLPAALDAVAYGGEIWMLDSANFNSGAVDIGKSVSIMAVPGQVGSIVAVAGQPALTVTASGLRIALRNLVVTNNVVYTGGSGLVISGNSEVSVEDCVFSAVNGVAIYVHDSAARVVVRNTTFRYISNGSVSAVNGPTVTVVSSHAMRAHGFTAATTVANTTTRLSVTDSTIDQPVNPAVGASSTIATGAVYVHVNRCTIHDATEAIFASGDGGTATVYVNSSSIADSTWGMYASGAGASIVSMGNNEISHTSIPITGPVTTATLY